MHIWTESPIKAMWQQLRYLKSPVNVTNLLSGKTQSLRHAKIPASEELRHRSYEVAACIEQADQYFHAAEMVGLATKPLLQFYGGQALAKAVILANDVDLRLSDLKYHGLSSRPSSSPAQREQLQAYASDPSAWEVESEFAIVNDGVLPHLAKVAGDRIPIKGQVLRFKELVRTIPDLSSLYSRHYGEWSHCFYLCEDPSLGKDGHFVVHFSGTTSDAVTEIFPEFAQGYQSDSRHDRTGFRSNEPVAAQPTFGMIVESAIAGKYYVRPHSCGLWTPMSLLYSGLFILSNVVRYKPAFWMSVLDGTGTGVASIVEAFCDLSERHFPSQILEHIWHEPFSFGSPGYFV